ncbi:MAG: geranylgeranylglycerol-phosphate geranylgeranyltransferase [Thaumarchaeota archaeon]|nr:geranylgeranylglycerol-phosphate geranylgeranyltransferase [Nitrososphaerota archaeon]MCL5316989.1 geranylgeranylglycerol-phosphate geranylgeranyltransferase [Nitrososphaerota archaeon]
MGTSTDLLKLTRPVNSIMVGFAVVVGVAVTSPQAVLSASAALGFLTGFFISSYSMVVNDYYDLEVDKINTPHRPLASGRITTRTAAAYAAILLILGIAAALPVGRDNLVIASTFAAIAWIYNAWGKKQMLLGNMMVAASVAIPYIYGGAAVGNADSPLLWFLALTSFLAATGREVVKTISDTEGDKVRGVKSIARVHGNHAAALAGAILFIGAVISTALPVVLRETGMLFSALILIPDALFIYVAAKVLKDNSGANALKIKKLTLLGMIIGMFVFIIGGVYRG